MNPYSRYLKETTSLERTLDKLTKRLADNDKPSKRISPRDFYAALAMAGMLAFGDTNNRSPKYLSKKAFEIADEMLEAR